MTHAPTSPHPTPAPARTVALPAHWKRGRRIAALGAAVFVLIFSGLLQSQGSADRLDSWWLRARFSGRQWLQNRLGTARPDARIALVEIDDKSLSRWRVVDKMGRETDELELELEWGKHIAQAIEQLQRSGARLVALDWSQTRETDARMNWDNDVKLGRALERMKNVVFVKAIGADGHYKLPAFSLLYSLPGAIEDGGQKYLGFADVVTDNGVQTALIPEIAPEKPGEPLEVSFPARVARNSGWPLRALPLRENNTLLINFKSNTGKRGDKSPFLRASLCDVARQTVPDRRWKDKIVFIGVTYKGSNDSHFVPFLDGLAGSQLVPGVEVQAHAAATLLEGSAIGEPTGAMIWLLSSILGGAAIVAFARWNWGRAARWMIGIALGWIALSGALFCAAHFALPLVLPLASLLIGSIGVGGYRAVFEERQRAQVMRVFGRIQDPRIIAEALANPDWRGGEGREMTVTVLFADLKDFTKTVEALPPAQALQALNRYLALFSDAIALHDGLVDKYLGDGLMAQWGAPLSRDDHAAAAVAACLEIQKRITALSPQLQSAGEVTFEARLTLHSGTVVAGPLGSESRLEYTIIGDTVNVTSRLQEAAKAMGCHFLISETTFEALQLSNGAVKIGREIEVEIRGRKAPLRVFEVTGAADEVGS